MLVCLTITGSPLPLKYTGFTHGLCTFWHLPLMVPSQWRTWRIEDNTRLENESRDIEDGQVLNKGMKDNNDRRRLAVST